LSPRPVFASVPEYHAALDAKPRKQLQAILDLVRATVPGSTPVISYGIPALKLDRVFFYAAAFKHHIGIFPPVSGDAALIKALKPYANAKGNLRFELNEPIPMALVRRVASALAANGVAAAAPTAKRAKAKQKRSRGG